MASTQLTASSISVSARNLVSFEGIKPSTVNMASFGTLKSGSSSRRRLVVQAATVVAPNFIVFQYTSIKPLGDRVLVKINNKEETSAGGILIPTSAQSKPQGGEVVAVGEGKTIAGKTIDNSVKTGAQVVYSKYAGTEIEFNGENHLLLKEDDIIGILETDHIKDLTPLNDRVLIKVTEAEEMTAGGLLLTDATKEKPSTGTQLDQVVLTGKMVR
ncbi:20 kDa chaperonin, chloroplastic [Linum perenne]